MDNGYGYAGKILRVDLASGKVSHIPTSQYAERFVGGRGIAAKIYWDLASPNVKPLDPENPLIIVTGPLAGFSGFASSRWQVCTKSPATIPEHFTYCNLGGHWGAQLKFAGYDGLVVEGASEKPVYMIINDDSVEIKDASHLWQKNAVEVRETIKGDLGREMRVLTTGPAGDNMVAFASLLADNDASGSSGTGAVMGSKKLKAIVVRGSGKVQAANPEKLKDLANYVRRLTEPPAADLEKFSAEGSKLRRESCFGCIGTCTERAVYQAEDGTRGKYMCQSGRFYGVRAQRFYGKETEASFVANRLCDSYGVDTNVVEMMIMWLVRLFYGKVLTDEGTGIPLSKIGSVEFIDELLRKISFREGIGDVLAHGPMRAAEIIGQGTPEMITDYISKSDQSTVYGPRMYVTTGLLYAMEPRQPIQQLHEVSRLVLKWVNAYKGAKQSYMTSDLIRRIGERFWGSEIAADFSTYEGKALAAKKIQDRQYIKESLILCDFSWPIADSETTEDHFGDPTIEHRIYSAVTGNEVDEEELYRTGERVFNLQRAILAREGHLGRKSDVLREVFYTTPLKSEYSNAECWGPGKDGEPLQKVGAVVDREKFEELKTEYYQLRGWDPASGLQTSAKLRELGMEDIAAGLARCGAVV